MYIKRFLLIRHGATRSSLERRYAADPDEPLCEEGVQAAALLGSRLPHVDAVFSAPARRCRNTAAILFPGVEIGSCSFRETDFGEFGGKNAVELLSDKDYEAWLDTGCMGDIPGGECVLRFKRLCCEAFLKLAESALPGTTALVLHGGNIMSILERFALPNRDFYEYYTPNCGFYLCRYSDGALLITVKGGPEV